MPRVKSKPASQSSQKKPEKLWKCKPHNLPLKYTCVAEESEQPFLCFICHKAQPTAYLKHTYSTPQGHLDVETESLYTSLGLNLKNNAFPLKDVFERVKEHMQLIWKKVEESIKKNLNQKLGESNLWFSKETVENSKAAHLERSDEESLLDYVKSIDSFTQNWLLKDPEQTSAEAQKLNSIFSNFAIKTEEIGNQICSLMQNSLSELSKEEYQTTSIATLLSRLKTEQLVISTTNEFSLSKRFSKFFTEQVDSVQFQQMLEMMNTKKTEEFMENRRMTDAFNSRFSTFSRHTLHKSKANYSDQQNKSKEGNHFENKSNPFVKDNASNTSSSNYKGKVRQSLPATGQWEGHSRPAYFTDSVKSQFNRTSHQFGRNSEMLPIHKSENISIAEGSHSKKYKASKTTEFNSNLSKK